MCNFKIFITFKYATLLLLEVSLLDYGIHYQDAITEHLGNNKLIRPSQHDFTAAKSCVTNLLEYLEVLTKLVNDGHAVNVVYCDFAKVIYKVQQQRLIIRVFQNFKSLFKLKISEIF